MAPQESDPSSRERARKQRCIFRMATMSKGACVLIHIDKCTCVVALHLYLFNRESNEAHNYSEIE